MILIERSNSTIPLSHLLLIATFYYLIKIDIVYDVNQIGLS